MKRIVKTPLPRSKSPLEWAVVGNGVLFTTQFAIEPDGSVTEGGFDAQVRRTLSNLKLTLEAAGATFADLTQIIVYVTDRDNLPAFNKIYGDTLSAPYPNRAAIVTTGFARAEMLIEILAYAAVS